MFLAETQQIVKQIKEIENLKKLIDYSPKVQLHLLRYVLLLKFILIILISSLL